MSAGRVHACGGGDCAKDRKADRQALVDACEAAGVRVVTTKCLDVCHGPVVVVVPAKGDPVVIERIRKPRSRRAVVAAAKGERYDEADLDLVRSKAARKAVRKALG